MKLCFTASFENQQVRKKDSFSMKKRGVNVWRICCKAVILHPLSREKRGTVEMLNRDEVLNLATFKKTFF